MDRIEEGDYVEGKTEGWVTFTRWPCRKGFVDVYVGDAAHNPNKEKKAPYQVNAFRSWIRLNGEGEWEEARHAHFLDYRTREEFSAERVFESITAR